MNSLECAGWRASPCVYQRAEQRKICEDQFLFLCLHVEVHSLSPHHSKLKSKKLFYGQC